MAILIEVVLLGLYWLTKRRMNRVMLEVKRYRLLVVLLLLTAGRVFGQYDVHISPDRRFELIVKVSQGSDLITRYAGRLVSLPGKDTTDLFDCLRHDLGRPNFYWSNDSKYLIFERCSDSFEQSSIAIFYLPEKKAINELPGLIGNVDMAQNQFDADRLVLIYFKTQGHVYGQIPDLYAFDLSSKQERKLLTFNEDMDAEFPQVTRIKGKQQLEVRCIDHDSGVWIKKKYLIKKIRIVL